MNGTNFSFAANQQGKVHLDVGGKRAACDGPIFADDRFENDKKHVTCEACYAFEFKVGELEDNTWRIAASRVEELQRRVEVLNRRVKRTGSGGLGIEVVREEKQFVKTAEEGGADRVKVYRWAIIRVTGLVPTIGGWDFVARVEHHAEVGNIVCRAPGREKVSLPLELRTASPECDHCKTDRRRKETFVLAKADGGELVRVGRNCLADFLRSEDVEQALRLWSLLYAIRSLLSVGDDEGCWGGSGRGELSTLSYLAAVSSVIRHDGWISRRVAREHNKQATADRADWLCGLPPRDPEDFAMWREMQPTDEDLVEAAKVVEWAALLAERPNLDDYLHNVRVACSIGYVHFKVAGIIASAVVARRREEDDKRRGEAEASQPRLESHHFGKVGSRYIRELSLLRTSDIDGSFGLTVLHVLKDAAGNVFKWFASGRPTLADGSRLVVGETYYFDFSVKQHGSYKGEAETTITRAAASKELHAPKWMSADGEVFKTKKALLAAQEVRA